MAIIAKHVPFFRKRAFMLLTSESICIKLCIMSWCYLQGCDAINLSYAQIGVVAVQGVGPQRCMQEQLLMLEDKSLVRSACCK